jgi:hypothetical protein
LGHSQNDLEIIELSFDNSKQETQYSISEVVDLRSNTQIIGSVMKGLGNNPRNANFPEQLDQYLLKAYSSIMDPDPNGKALVMLINKFEISEVIFGSVEYGFLEMEFEFAVSKNGELLSQGVYEVVHSKSGMDVTKKHDDIILEGLQKSLRLLPYLEVYSGSRDTITKSPIEIDPTIWKAPKPGLYNSFVSVILEQPIIESGFEFDQASGTSKHPAFYLKTDLDDALVDLTLFASDGESLYMQGARSHTSNLFLPVVEYGPILYFEDKFSDPNAAMAFGLIGAAASNNGRAIILDTRTRESKRLTNYVLYHLSKGHPGLMKTYRKSKRKLEDKHQFISDLNLAILANDED